MVRNVAPEMAELEPEDFYLLSGVEQGMRFSEWVQTREDSRTSRGLTAGGSRVSNRPLSRTATSSQRKTIQYEGYTAHVRGLRRARASDVLRARDDRGRRRAARRRQGERRATRCSRFRPMALKFHREGYTNFREVMKERDYTSDNEPRLVALHRPESRRTRVRRHSKTLYPDVARSASDRPQPPRHRDGEDRRRGTRRARSSRTSRSSPSSTSCSAR